MALDGVDNPLNPDAIEQYDVEPAVGRKFWPRVLGVVSAVTGVLAIIGWPLPIISGRHREAHAWQRTVQGAQDWLAHDGWRMSGSSWIYGAAAAAALCGAIVLLHPKWNAARKWVVAVGPAGALLVIGPAVQWVLGVPYANYGEASRVSTCATVLGIVVGLVAASFSFGLRALVRKSVRPQDDVNPPPRGMR